MYRQSFCLFVIGAFLSFSPKIAQSQELVKTYCHMGECIWSAYENLILIRETADGKLMGATTKLCVTKIGENPRRRCTPDKIQIIQQVAFCSQVAPSISFKNDEGNWNRTQLSISDKGLFGYNREQMSDYLRICHGFTLANDNAVSLDIVGAKFGYRDRYSSLDGNEQDVVDNILQLADVKPRSAPREPDMAQKHPAWPSANSPAPDMSPGILKKMLRRNN